MGLIANEHLRREVIKNAWPAFASLSWAAVMYIFRWHPETVQPSLRSSMSYMWVFRFLISSYCWQWTSGFGEWCRMRYTDLSVVTCNPTTGTRCGISFGITNEPPLSQVYRDPKTTLSFMHSNRRIVRIIWILRYCTSRAFGTARTASCTDTCFSII
jgi:hypothetical protein